MTATALHMRRAAWLVFAALLIGGGLWVRLDRLAAPSFDIDEYLHVFAAQSLNTTGKPLLPSGQEYGRALPYTRLVALSFKLTGAVNEFTARLPSALLDLGVFTVVFLMTRSWLGAPAAAAATALLVFAPWWIIEAKNCRMYTLLNLIHLTTAWAAWQALEGRSRRWLWVVLALAAAWFGTMVHRLSVNFAAALGVFIIAQAVITRRRFYVLLALAGAAVAAVAVASHGVDPAKLWREANTAPSWADNTRYAWGYYLRHWWAMYPLLVILYPVAILRAWRRYQALGLFLFCALAVPFALHSVVFDWKRLRYALYLLPWLMIPVAALLVAWTNSLLASRRGWRVGVAALLAAAALFPWAGQVTATPQRFPSPAWRGTYDWLRPQLQTNDVVLSSMPLATLYYLGRPVSYVMNNVHIKEGASKAKRGADGFYQDYYSGRPMVTTKEELQRVVAGHPRGWILIDASRFQGRSTLTEETQAYITSTMQPAGPEDAGVGRPVVVYRWPRTAEGAAP